MPIRYFIDLGCPPREELGPEGLLQTVVTRERAEAVRAQFEEEYGVTDQDKMRFREKSANAQGQTESRERSVADLMSETAVLEKLAPHCAGCPAELEPGVPFSCIQSISLPIGERAERWLVDHLAPAGSRCLEMYVEWTSQRPVNPALDNWRKSGLLQAKTAPIVDRGGLAMGSSPLLSELFFVGDIGPAHALGVLMHLGAMKTADGRRGDEVLALFEEIDRSGSAEDAPEIDFAWPPRHDDDDSTREIKLFLYACFRAFSLQVPLAVRL